MSKEFSIHEVAKMVGLSNVKLIQILSENKILFKSNKVNLPKQTYIKKGYFKVFPVKKEVNGNKETFPMIRITQEGFNFIVDFIRKERSLAKLEYLVNKKMFSKFSELGLEYDKNRVIVEIEPNGDVSYLLFHNNEFITLVKYSKIKMTIL